MLGTSLVLKIFRHKCHTDPVGEVLEPFHGWEDRGSESLGSSLLPTKITHENREVLCQDLGRSSSDPLSRVLVSSRGPDRGLLVSPLGSREPLSERGKSGDVLQGEADHCPLGCPR